MRVRKLSFTEGSQGWSFDDFTFDSLTLLVGASGSGKTQTIHSIDVLSQIAHGVSVDGIKWDVTFDVRGDKGPVACRWTGETQRLNLPINVRLWEDGVRAKILSEELWVEGEKIVERSGVDITFKGNPMIKLSPYLSVLFILRQEEAVAKVYRAFRRVHLIDRTSGDDLKDVRRHTNAFCKAVIDHDEYGTIERIRRSPFPAIVKLDMAHRIKSPVYDEILDRFKEIFPQVTAIRMAPLDTENRGYLSTIPFLQIKERGSKVWIPQFNLSAGMSRTLSQIAEMYLCPEGTLFLIDEFENSLGANIIDDMTDQLFLSDRDLQFIISTHSAYIINNIDVSLWRLITRDGSRINMRPVSELMDEESDHEHYMQLLQLDEYRNGRQA